MSNGIFLDLLFGIEVSEPVGAADWADQSLPEDGGEAGQGEKTDRTHHQIFTALAPVICKAVIQPVAPLGVKAVKLEA